jgi:hypothetical protein
MDYNIIKNENFSDPVVQDHCGTLKNSASIINFDDMSNACGCYPPDPNGDIGPNHIVQSVNSQFQIWNKSGTSLYGPVVLQVFLAGFLQISQVTVELPYLIFRLLLTIMLSELV